MCTYAPLVLDPLISKVHILTRENQPIEWLTWISRSTLCKTVEMYCSGISFFFHIWDSQIFNFFCVANQVETILKNKSIFYFIKIILWKNWKKGCLVIVKWTRVVALWVSSCGRLHFTLDSASVSIRHISISKHSTLSTGSWKMPSISLSLAVSLWGHQRIDLSKNLRIKPQNWVKPHPVDE